MSSRRDYKLGSSWQHRRRLRLHGLLVLTLVVVGLFGSLLAYVRSKSAPELAQSQGQPTVGREHTVEAAKPAEPAPAPTLAFKPKYDFYKVLPERKLVVTNQGGQHPTTKTSQGLPPVDLIGRSTATNPSGTAGKAAEQKDRTEKKKNAQSLDAGSFRDRAEADRRKASMQALGIPARVETITGADGSKKHWVRVGPVRDATEMKALKQRLQQNNIPVADKATR
ncbi:MAG: SPOR domain-containing protein [Candidatus Competibacteraceae bacterium]